MKKDAVPAEVISPGVLAAFLGVSRPTIYNWIEQGRLSSFPFTAGGRTFHALSRQAVEQVLGRALVEEEWRRLLAQRPPLPKAHRSVGITLPVAVERRLKAEAQRTGLKVSTIATHALSRYFGMVA
jgi:excisionase family DNA binding protein